MLQLPTDILYDVFLDVWASELPSFLNICLVCQKWHQIAQRILNGRLDRLVIGPGTEESNNRRFDRIDNDSMLQKSVYMIQVQDVFASGLLFKGNVPPPPPGNPEPPGRRRGIYGYLEQSSDITIRQLDRLAYVIFQASELRIFRWEAKPRLPPVILHALYQWPNCRIEIPFRDSDYYGPPKHGFVFPSIETPTSLYQLQPLAHRIVELGVTLPGAWHPDHTQDFASDHSGSFIGTAARFGFTPSGPNVFQVLSDIVSHAPLNSLSVHAAGSLIVGDGFLRVPSLSWLTAVRSRPLSLSSLRLTNFCLCRATSEEILAFQSSIDWSKLRSAHFTCPTLLLSLPSLACQLISLVLFLDPSTIHFNHACSMAPDFIAIRHKILEQHRLQHLTISQGLGIFETEDEEADHAFLKHLGNSIVSLIIREPEPPDLPAVIPEDRPSLLLNTLVMLGKTCPFLRTLEIPAPDVEVAYVVYLVTIGKHLRFIHHLTLSLSVRGPVDSPSRHPLPLEFIRNIWATMSLSDSKSKFCLRSFTLAVGAYIHGERIHPISALRGHDNQRRYRLQKTEPWQNTAAWVYWCVEFYDLMLAKKGGQDTAYPAYPLNYETRLLTAIEHGVTAMDLSR